MKDVYGCPHCHGDGYFDLRTAVWDKTTGMMVQSVERHGCVYVSPGRTSYLPAGASLRAVPHSPGNAG